MTGAAPDNGAPIGGFFDEFNKDPAKLVRRLLAVSRAGGEGALRAVRILLAACLSHKTSPK